MIAKMLPQGHSEATELCEDCDGEGVVDLDPEDSGYDYFADEAFHMGSEATGHSFDLSSDAASATFNLRQVLTGKKTLDEIGVRGLADLTRIKFESRTLPYTTPAGSPNRNTSMPLPVRSKIMGALYREAEQHQALQSKNEGNRILIVPEPGNKHDKAALAILVAKGVARKSNNSSYIWMHVGYVPRDQAAELAKVWPRYKRTLLVGEGHLACAPRNGGVNCPVGIENKFRDYFVD